MIALYFAGDIGVRKYFDRIMSGKAAGFVSDVNLAEFYYKTGQKLGEVTAKVRCNLIANSHIESVSTDPQMAMAAGKWKLRGADLSLADCFALASLERHANALLTTDAELKKVAKSKAVLFEV